MAGVASQTAGTPTSKHRIIQVDGGPDSAAVVHRAKPRFEQSVISCHLHHYGSFFLLGVELRLAGELMILEDSAAETKTLVGPDSRLESHVLRRAVTTAVKTCGIDNVARVHYGQPCVLYEVDFISSNHVLKFLKTLQSHAFETSLLELLSKVDTLDAMKLSLSVNLYLAKPLLAQKECALTTVTLSNYRDCISILSNSMIFDYQSTRDDRFTRPEPTIQLVLKDLQGLTRWFSLGINLDIPYSQVKTFCRQYGDDDQRALTEVIHTWINNGEASWPSLSVALKNCGEIERAKQIATKYDCKGVLLISLKEQSVKMDDSMKKLLSVEKDNKILVTSLDELKKNLQGITENAAKIRSQQENMQENLKRQIELKTILQQQKNDQRGDEYWIESAIEETVTMIEFLKQQLHGIELELKEKELNESELKIAIAAKTQELQQTEEVAETLHQTCQQLYTTVQSMVSTEQAKQQGEEIDESSFKVGSGLIAPTGLLGRTGRCLKCDELRVRVDIFRDPRDDDQCFTECPDQQEMKEIVQRDHNLHSTKFCHLL